MKRQSVKLNRHGYDRAIQHLPRVKDETKAASRKFRQLTKMALRLNREPPITISGGDRY
jgi:hypothetical protein